MTCQSCVGIAGLALIVATASPQSQAPADPAAKVPAASQAAADAAKASPDLVGELSKEISATPEQAAGAAGALFGIAKSKLKPEEFWITNGNEEALLRWAQLNDVAATALEIAGYEDEEE